jgi:hypothetical protein
MQDRTLVHLERRRKRRHDARHVRFGHLDDEIDIERRSGLAADRARQRAADNVPQATGFQGVSDVQRYSDWAAAHQGTGSVR